MTKVGEVVRFTGIEVGKENEGGYVRFCRKRILNINVSFLKLKTKLNSLLNLSSTVNITHKQKATSV